ncbi:MAG: tRNA uridine-5-carboxymethylaminomethyl(34) synthesis GTPase MnmE, partial [Cyclobacteriaceae bacterium]
ERTKDKMKKASLIIYLVDLTNTTVDEIEKEIEALTELGIPYIKVGNKLDKADPKLMQQLEQQDFIFISAKQQNHIDELKEKILSLFEIQNVKTGDVMVTNLRHYQNLLQTNESLSRVLDGMDNGVTGDFLAMDIRQSLHYLGEITGSITSEDLLANIFGKFCIGK